MHQFWNFCSFHWGVLIILLKQSLRSRASCDIWHQTVLTDFSCSCSRFSSCACSSFRFCWRTLCSSSICGGAVSSWYESPLPRLLGAPQTALRKARATSEHSPHCCCCCCCRPPLRLPPSSTLNSLPSPSLQHATALVIPGQTEK